MVVTLTSLLTLIILKTLLIGLKPKELEDEPIEITYDLPCEAEQIHSDGSSPNHPRDPLLNNSLGYPNGWVRTHYLAFSLSLYHGLSVFLSSL